MFEKMHTKSTTNYVSVCVSIYLHIFRCPLKKYTKQKFRVPTDEIKTWKCTHFLGRTVNHCISFNCPQKKKVPHFALTTRDFWGANWQIVAIFGSSPTNNVTTSRSRVVTHFTGREHWLQSKGPNRPGFCLWFCLTRFLHLWLLLVLSVRWFGAVRLPFLVVNEEKMRSEALV